MKTIYVSQKDNRSWSTSSDAFGGETYPVVVPKEFMGGAMTYNCLTGEWVPDPVYVRTHADDVHDATITCDQLIQEANSIMYGWSIDVQTGDITPEDLIKLKAWRLYVKALNALELDAAPDVEWPPRPEN